MNFSNSSPFLAIPPNNKKIFFLFSRVNNAEATFVALLLLIINLDLVFRIIEDLKPTWQV